MIPGLKERSNMSMETKHPPEQNPQRGSGYERRDANIHGLLQFAFWLAVVLAITMVSMVWTFHYFSKTAPLGPPASPLPEANVRRLPPSPVLQAHPHQDLQNYCAEQERLVSTYGWVDQQSGVVRLPIDRAVDLILARGLPTRPAGEAPPGASTEIAPPLIPVGEDIQGQCGYVQEQNEAEAAIGPEGNEPEQ
jgi:hypothetical protein